ncbi:MAG: hypothetical protein ACR2N3_06525 [Pyrinomonadaceae bacterium]
MNENRISISLSPADMTAINQAIDILARKLQPILIALDAEDKRMLDKLGEKSISYVNKIVQYAANNPEFLPAYIDAAEFKKDYEAFTVLNGFLRPLAQIVKNLDDTATLRGSEAVSASNTYYSSVKQGVKMDVPNAKAIYDDLSRRYEAQKARRLKPEPLK